MHNSLNLQEALEKDGTYLLMNEDSIYTKTFRVRHGKITTDTAQKAVGVGFVFNEEMEKELVEFMKRTHYGFVRMADGFNLMGILCEKFDHGHGKGHL